MNISVENLVVDIGASRVNIFFFFPDSHVQIEAFEGQLG